MRIGNLNINGRVFCAPMAGISNPVYRVLARRYGAATVYSEMISIHGLIYNNKRTVDMLKFGPEERPIGIQLFGADPELMAQAVQIVSKRNPDLIDLNFGCPVKKVVNKNGGAAVLKDLKLTAELVAAAVSASKIPVTVKLRSGWDENSKVYLEAGRVCQEAGAEAVALHARTRSGMFSGKADWSDIKKLKDSLSVPVIGNGDITCGADAARMIEETGCDAVMIGRAAMGNPRIFHEINYYLGHGEDPPEAGLIEKIELIRDHARLLAAEYGELRGMLKMRRILMRYVKGWGGVSELRRRGTAVESLADLEEILTEYLANQEPEQTHAS